MNLKCSLFGKNIYNSGVLVRIMQNSANNSKYFKAHFSICKKWNGWLSPILKRKKTKEWMKCNCHTYNKKTFHSEMFNPKEDLALHLTHAYQP